MIYKNNFHTFFFLILLSPIYASSSSSLSSTSTSVTTTTTTASPSIPLSTSNNNSTLASTSNNNSTLLIQGQVTTPKQILEIYEDIYNLWGYYEKRVKWKETIEKEANQQLEVIKSKIDLFTTLGYKDKTNSQISEPTLIQETSVLTPKSKENTVHHSRSVSNPILLLSQIVKQSKSGGSTLIVPRQLHLSHNNLIQLVSQSTPQKPPPPQSQQDQFNNNNVGSNSINNINTKEFESSERSKEKKRLGQLNSSIETINKDRQFKDTAAALEVSNSNGNLGGTNVPDKASDKLEKTNYQPRRTFLKEKILKLLKEANQKLSNQINTYINNNETPSKYLTKKLKITKRNKELLQIINPETNHLATKNEEILQIARDYYEQLYQIKECNEDTHKFLLNTFTNKIDEETIKSISNPIQEEEIRLCLEKLQEAFGSISHKAIIRTLLHLKLPIKLITTIKNLLSNSETSLYINNQLSKPFISRRGTKQGDPISPTIFALLVECMATATTADKSLRGLGMHKTKILQFADDHSNMV
ncbi:hypothetical protein ACTFIV_000809 [Dictyostelium citrinum]